MNKSDSAGDWKETQVEWQRQMIGCKVERQRRSKGDLVHLTVAEVQVNFQYFFTVRQLSKSKQITISSRFTSRRMKVGIGGNIWPLSAWPHYEISWNHIDKS